VRAGIVNYRMGNLASVSKALERVGAESFVSGDPAELTESDLVVLPGVGNFAAGMANLRRAGLDGFVKDWAGAGRPLLGICMGMQLLFGHSEEGDTPGLGILPGRVVRMSGDPGEGAPGLKVPHMGWNTLSDTSGIFSAFEGKYFYFVHSYACVPDGGAAATTLYGVPFASAAVSGAVVGVQFHPEKSSHDGLALLGAALRAFAPAA
jgi:glutamine amidotransferase